MKEVNILRDGSVYPPLAKGGLMIKLLNGDLIIGKFEKEFYLQEYENYITEPCNAFDLKKEVIKFINTQMPELFSKHYVVHLTCPAEISSKVQWHRV